MNKGVDRTQRRLNVPSRCIAAKLKGTIDNVEATAADVQHRATKVLLGLGFQSLVKCCLV